MRENLNDIIEGCKIEDRVAQANLYKRFAPALYAICLRYCSHTQDAEDCLHDGFMKIFSQIRKYKNNVPFEGWIKRLMINFCIDKYRRRVMMESIDESHFEGYETEDDDFGADEDMLLEALSVLPPRYRAIFNLFAIENYSHKEIAEEFNIAESTSRSNYLRAKRIVSKKMTELHHHAG